MPLNKSRLRESAKAATAGEWFVDPGRYADMVLVHYEDAEIGLGQLLWYDGQPFERLTQRVDELAKQLETLTSQVAMFASFMKNEAGLFAVNNYGPLNGTANAKYIAEANPQNVLALLDENAKLLKALRKLTSAKDIGQFSAEFVFALDHARLLLQEIDDDPA